MEEARELLVGANGLGLAKEVYSLLSSSTLHQGTCVFLQQMNEMILYNSLESMSFVLVAVKF